MTIRILYYNTDIIRKQMKKLSNYQKKYNFFFWNIR